MFKRWVIEKIKNYNSCGNPSESWISFNEAAASKLILEAKNDNNKDTELMLLTLCVLFR